MGSSAAPSLRDLADRYYAAGDFTRKGETYFASYARLLAERRDAPLALLELGISSGASLLIWRDYLPNATIVGIDIDEAPARVVGQERIHCIRGSQDDPVTLDKAAQLVGGRFDFIIDDASHIGYLTKRALHYLFPRILAPGGWYVVEDFGTGFLPQYPDGIAYTPPDWADAQPATREFRSSQFGMVGVLKQLIDNLMQDLSTGSPSYLSIERIIFETNIAFIEKSQRPGGAWPGYISELPARPPEPANPPSVPPGAVEELQQALENHGGRLADLERIVNDLRRYLAPLLWVRRSFRR